MRHTLVVLAFLAVATGPVSGAVAADAGGAAVPANAATGADADCSFPVTRTDATGTEVTLDAEPERVVVLAPSAAQVLWDVGAREKVVGMPVTQYTAYLDGSDERTNVVNQQGQPSLERVVELSPDLVLAPNVVDNGTVTQLRDAGVTVYRAGFGRSLADIYAKTELYGRLVGECGGARQVANETRADVSAVRAAVEGRDRPPVLYYFFNFTAGNGTFIHEVIETAGGDNVAAAAGVTGYQQLNPEVVVERNPGWVVVPSDAQFPQGEPYASTAAYRNNRTLVVNTNYISQPGPRIVIPMRRMAERFHPEAFATTPTPSPTRTPTPTPTPAVGTGATPTPTAASGPGFGFVAAAAGVAFVGLLARRR